MGDGVDGGLGEIGGSDEAEEGGRGRKYRRRNHDG